MRIIRTIESFYPYMSGPANQVFNISSRLSPRFSTILLTTDFRATKAKREETLAEIKVKRFSIKWKFMKYFFTPEMKKEFVDFDLVHAHSFRSYQTELGYRMARKCGKPFVLSNHGSVLGYASFVTGWKVIPYKLYDFFHKKIVLDADAVVVNTRQEYDEAIKYGVDKGKIHIIPVGIDVAEYTPKKKTWEETRLLFVGRITRDRNLEPVIRAVKLLENENLTLRIVGESAKRTDTEKEGYLDEIKRLIKDLGVGDKVEFVGPKYGKELKEYYRTSDIFIYTSLWENFGQTILEAAAAGLPLVCSRVGVALDIVNDGISGTLVDACSVEQIKHALKLFFDPRKRSRARRELIATVKNKYSWNDIVSDYEQMYRDLAEVHA